MSALLSQALVAFTIEFDNEFERRVPHRTTDFGSTPGERQPPWLVSMAMWRLLLRHLPAEGTTAPELLRRTGLSRSEFRMWLQRLSTWWGYLSVGSSGSPLHTPSSQGSGTPRRGARAAHSTATHIRPTANGQRAIQVWLVLTAEIEQHWQTRFGVSKIAELRRSLGEVVEALLYQRGFLPDQLPVLGFQLFSHRQSAAEKSGEAPSGSVSSELPGLLSQALVAFAWSFEANTGLSLAAAANVLRIATREPQRIADLLARSGIAEPAFTVATKRLVSQGLVHIGPLSSATKARGLALTDRGLEASREYFAQTAAVEVQWRRDLGVGRITALRRALEALAGGAALPVLLSGTAAASGCWRAALPERVFLPYFPMITHRGGYPDGS